MALDSKKCALSATWFEVPTVASFAMGLI